MGENAHSKDTRQCSARHAGLSTAEKAALSPRSPPGQPSTRGPRKAGPRVPGQPYGAHLAGRLAAHPRVAVVPESPALAFIHGRRI